MKLINADSFLKEIISRCGCIPYVEGRNGEAIYLNNLINEQVSVCDVNNIMKRLESELILAGKEKERCIKENALQFDEAKGYGMGIETALEIVKTEFNK